MCTYAKTMIRCGRGSYAEHVECINSHCCRFGELDGKEDKGSLKPIKNTILREDGESPPLHFHYIRTASATITAHSYVLSLLFGIYLAAVSGARAWEMTRGEDVLISFYIAHVCVECIIICFCWRSILLRVFSTLLRFLFTFCSRFARAKERKLMTEHFIWCLSTPLQRPRQTSR